MSVEFKFGADPEFFLKDKETGKHVSAYGMIEGTKHDPLRVTNGAVQVDGMALEFNIDPVTNVEDWEKNITSVLADLRGMIDPRYEFDFVPVAHFGKEYIDAQPDEAKELGCDPDYNAYTGEINPAPDGGMGFRTASGHIHIGWTEGEDITDKGHIEAGHMLAYQLDRALGCASLLWDRDSTRRKMYGKWGALRYKPYGMEYRVLSNVWVNDPVLRKFVFKMAKGAAKNLLSGRRIYSSDPTARYNSLLQTENYSSAKSIYNDLRYYTEMFRVDGVNSDFRHRLIKDERNEHLVFNERTLSKNYFYSIATHETVHYDDISIDQLNTGVWQEPFKLARTSKEEGLTLEQAKARTYIKKKWVVKDGQPTRISVEVPVIEGGDLIGGLRGGFIEADEDVINEIEEWADVLEPVPGGI